MNENKTNGKMTEIEKEMAIDQIVEAMPAIVKMHREYAKILHEKYKSFIDAGFIEHQAFELVKHRSVIERD